MFFTFVCLPFCSGGRGSPCDHYPWCIGTWVPDMGLLTLTSTEIWWSSLETCSNLFIWGPTPPLQLSYRIGVYGTAYSWQSGGTHPIKIWFAYRKKPGSLQDFPIETVAVADTGFSPGGGVNFHKPIIFQIFCWKLHENERIRTPGASLAPP